MEILVLYGPAAAAFVAAVLGVLALAMFWEGSLRLVRQRSLSRELHRLSERSRSVHSERASGLLKEVRGELPAWLAPVAARIPRLSDLNLLLEQSRSTWSGSGFLILTFGLALALGTVAVLVGLGWFSLAAAAAGATIPYLILLRRRKRRLRAFEEDFPEAIDLLARSARAGHALQSGLREVAEESRDPIREEFRQVFEEQKFGLPLTESLLGLADRVDIVDVRLFVTALLIQKETGGNLAENLDNLSEIIRERFRFKRQINVHTAHGRMTGAVLAAAPLVMLFLLNMVSPEYMRPLFMEPLGRMMLAGAAMLQIFGFLVIRRLTDIEY